MGNDDVNIGFSAGMLREMGHYGLQLMIVPRIVRLRNKYKIPYLALLDVLNLLNLNKEAVASVEIYPSDNINIDPYKLVCTVPFNKRLVITCGSRAWGKTHDSG